MKNLACFVSLLVLGVTPAFATTVTVGGTAESNVFPFGCGTGCTFPYLGEYQQIYASSAFSGPLTITQVAFQTRTSGHTISDDFVLGLGTTSATPSATGTNYATNKQADFTTVFTGVVGVPTTALGGFDFIINLTTPFTYNPASGNLLLDVFINSDSPGAGTGLVSGLNPLVGRVYNFGGTGSPASGPQEGLLTQFSGDPAGAAVPEPISIVLLGSGLLGTSVRRYRRR